MSSSNGDSASIVVIEPAPNLESVGDRLTAQQHAVLSLLASGQSVIAAAEGSGIHRGTIHRWLSTDPNEHDDRRTAGNCGRGRQQGLRGRST